MIRFLNLHARTLRPDTERVACRLEIGRLQWYVEYL